MRLTLKSSYVIREKAIAWGDTESGKELCQSFEADSFPCTHELNPRKEGKMKKILASLTVVSILAGWACTQKSESPEETKTRIQQESADVRKVIEAINADLGRWYATGDIDSVATVFAEDARQMPPNGAAIEGREAMRAFWKQAVSWGIWNFNLKTVSVIANGPIAVELGRYSLKFTPGPDVPSGMTGYEDTGNYVCYWRLSDDGKWRVVYDIANRDQPLQ